MDASNNRRAEDHSDQDPCENCQLKLFRRLHEEWLAARALDPTKAEQPDEKKDEYQIMKKYWRDWLEATERLNYVPENRREEVRQLIKEIDDAIEKI